MSVRLLAALAALLSVIASASAAPAAARTIFSPDEVASILQHGPWPPRRMPDASNRIAASARAAAFGQRLFFDTRLSNSGTISCASCHVPEWHWTDRRATATGLGDAERNTPTNARCNSTSPAWASSEHDAARSRRLAPGAGPSSSSTTSTLPSGHNCKGPPTSANSRCATSRASHCSGGMWPMPGRSMA